MSGITDFSLPESWLAEDANERQCAKDLRAEAAMLLEQINRLKGDVFKLETSRMTIIQQAALIERRLRGLV